MNVLGVIKTAWNATKRGLNRAIGAVQNFYQTHFEAAEVSTSRYRKGAWWGYGRVPDPREVNTPHSRLEIIRRAQDLERNNSFARRLATIFVTYTVGSGLPIRPASSDEDWNTERKILWDRWCENPDLTSTQDFDSFQVMCAWRSWFDGAGYILKTRGNVKPFRPRVQFIEAANIQTPPSLTERKNIFDGKETDSRGRIAAYYVRQVVNGDESFARVDAKDIIPICDFDRPGDLHSFSYLAPVLNDIHDLDELCKLAMDKAKEAAEIKNVFKTENAEIPDAEEARGDRYDTQGTTSTGDAFTAERMQVFEQKLGGKSIALGLNESVDQLRAESPNEIEQAHYRLIAGRVCAGTNIPLLLVFPESIQGTVGRAILDDFTTYIRSQSKIFQRAWRSVYAFVTEEETKFELKISDPPSDWQKCRLRAPMAPNVDKGNSSASMIAEVEAGTRTLESVCGPRGEDEYEMIDKIADEVAYIHKAAERKKVSPDQIRKSIGDSLKLQMEKEQAEKIQTEADEDKELAAK